MTYNPLTAAFQSLAVQTPTLLVILVACIVIILNWQISPGASMFALMGFGLALAIGIVAPVVGSFVQYSLINGGTSNGVHTVGMISAMLGVLWTILKAVSYALILAAVYVGRSAPRTATQPPLR